MPGLLIKVNSRILPIVTLKLVAMTTSLEPSKKGVRSVIYDQVSTIWWKFGESKSWDNFAQSLFLIKKKWTQAEHNIRGPCMPRGLKYDFMTNSAGSLCNKRLVPWPSIDIHWKFYGDRHRGNPSVDVFKRKRVTKYSDFWQLECYNSQTVQYRR